MCSLPVLRLEAWALCSSWRLWKGILPCLLSAPGGYSITSTSAFIFMWLPVSLVCPWYVWLFATLWTVAHQAPLSMEFSRQEYWGGLPFPSPGDLTDPGIEPRSPALQADSLLTELQGKFPKATIPAPWKKKRMRQVKGQEREIIQKALQWPLILQVS